MPTTIARGGKKGQGKDDKEEYGISVDSKVSKIKSGALSARLGYLAWS
jgi:hypothetical protein